MGWFKEPTRAEEIASLIERKESLDKRIIATHNKRNKLLEEASSLREEYEKVAAALAKLGIK